MTWSQNIDTIETHWDTDETSMLLQQVPLRHTGQKESIAWIDCYLCLTLNRSLSSCSPDKSFIDWVKLWGIPFETTTNRSSENWITVYNSNQVTFHIYLNKLFWPNMSRERRERRSIATWPVMPVRYGIHGLHVDMPHAWGFIPLLYSGLLEKIEFVNYTAQRTMDAMPRLQTLTYSIGPRGKSTATTWNGWQ